MFAWVGHCVEAIIWNGASTTAARMGARRAWPVRNRDRQLTLRTWLYTRMRPIPVMFCLVLGLAGCSITPGSGPWMGGAQSESSEALPFDVIDLTPVTVAAVSRPVDVNVPSSIGDLPASGRVSVAPGDQLRVRVFEQYSGNIFPTLVNPGADLGVQQVSD
jgi:polysaccharide export outer membrane protein